jgi:hypothetical protein
VRFAKELVKLEFFCSIFCSFFVPHRDFSIFHVKIFFPYFPCKDFCVCVCVQWAMKSAFGKELERLVWARGAEEVWEHEHEQLAVAGGVGGWVGGGGGEGGSRLEIFWVVPNVGKARVEVGDGGGGGGGGLRKGEGGVVAVGQLKKRYLCLWNDFYLHFFP